MVQGVRTNPRKNHGELFRAILRFAEHLRGNHGESVWVITPNVLDFLDKSGFGMGGVGGVGVTFAILWLLVVG